MVFRRTSGCSAPWPTDVHGQRADGAGDDALALVRSAWSSFSRGDLSAAADLLDPDVRWHADGDPHGGCQNRDEALAFIRTTLAEGVTAEAYDLRLAGDRVVVLVRVHHPPQWGEQPEPHGEVVSVRGGRIVQIVVHPTESSALAAAGAAG